VTGAGMFFVVRMMVRRGDHPDLLERFTRFLAGRSFRIEAGPTTVRVVVYLDDGISQAATEGPDLPTAVRCLLAEQDPTWPAPQAARDGHHSL